MPDPLGLTALLRSATDQAAARTRKKQDTIEKAPKKPIISTYANPENWTETRIVTLIHQGEHETLLGNFQEFTHKFGARKLVRIEAPHNIGEKEYVTGDWWVRRPDEKLKSGGRWSFTHRIVAGISLKELMLHAPSVDVDVTTYMGHISAVSLVSETRLFSTDFTKHLILDADTDILACLDFDTKLDLKSQIETLEGDDE